MDLLILSDSEENRRSLFRLRFPLEEQPSLVTELEDYKVLEFAENSARLVANGTSICSDKWTPAVIKLKTGAEICTNVKLSRIEDDNLIVSLEKHITQKDIMSEQRRLLAKYGKPGLLDH